MSKQNLASLEKRISAIEKRNEQVETDKAWETSWQRKALVIVLTYSVVLAYFVFINIDRPMLSALVPTLGYYLSTLTIKGVKTAWIKSRD